MIRPVMPWEKTPEPVLCDGSPGNPGHVGEPIGGRSGDSPVTIRICCSGCERCRETGPPIDWGRVAEPTVATLREQLDGLRSEIREVRARIDRLKKAIEELEK